jgi:Ribosomal protein S1
MTMITNSSSVPLFDNPWDNFLANNKIGSIVEALISEIDERKLIVKLSEEIIGIIPFQEANIEKIYKLTDKFKTGDKVLAKIKSLEPKKKRVVLSIKEYYEEEQNKELEKFLFNKEETKLTRGSSRVDLQACKLGTGRRFTTS